MSTEESAIFEREKGRLLDEITKARRTRKSRAEAFSQYPPSFRVLKK